MEPNYICTRCKAFYYSTDGKCNLDKLTADRARGCAIPMPLVPVTEQDLQQWRQLNIDSENAKGVDIHITNNTDYHLQFTMCRNIKGDISIVVDDYTVAPKTTKKMTI